MGRRIVNKMLNSLEKGGLMLDKRNFNHKTLRIQWIDCVFYLCATILGYILCVSVAKLIVKVSFIQKILSYIGQNTMSILLLHELAFKCVTIFQILIYKDSMSLPDYVLVLLPTLISTGSWPDIYTIVGVAIPLGLNTMYKHIRYK